MISLNYLLKSLLAQNISSRHQLSGVRIWLSGAIPERQHWSHSLVDRDILEFVSVFSAMVFESGGTIIHGSHPSLTPIIKRQAERFSKTSDQLQLYISSHWEQEKEEGKYTKFKLNSIPSQYNENTFDLDKSLSTLRLEMANSANVAVFIGGKLHLDTQHKAGIPEEMDLAEKYSIPSYVLGGIDGAAQKIVDDTYLTSINRISRPSLITNLSREKDIYILPSQIIGDLILNRKKIRIRRTHG